MAKQLLIKAVTGDTEVDYHVDLSPGRGKSRPGDLLRESLILYTLGDQTFVTVTREDDWTEVALNVRFIMSAEVVDTD